jgi:hypothetical protein
VLEVSDEIHGVMMERVECAGDGVPRLQNVKSRPAKVSEKLRTQHFNTGTIGFAAPEDATRAACVLPGTELAFAPPVGAVVGAIVSRGLLDWKRRAAKHTTAISRQINKGKPLMHHDAVEFPDGQKAAAIDEGNRSSAVT